MTIKTKHKIGSEVWANFANTPILCTVVDITMVEEEPYIMVVYTVCSANGRIFGTRYGNELFLTKEELLKNL